MAFKRPCAKQSYIFDFAKFKQHAFVVSANIAKMYRQIPIGPSPLSLQQLLWRFQPSELFHVYVLNTTTCGTATASFFYLHVVFILQLSHAYAESQPGLMSQQDLSLSQILLSVMRKYLIYYPRVVSTLEVDLQ